VKQFKNVYFRPLQRCIDRPLCKQVRQLFVTRIVQNRFIA